MKFDWIFLKIIHFDVNSDVNFQPFSMQICKHYRLVLRQLPCKFGEVWFSTSKVINEISVKFDWIFVKVMHFDVNSDVNSHPFSMQICKHYRLVLRQLPCKFGEVWFSPQKLLMRLVWNLIEYFEKLFISTWIQTSILNRFPCKFAVTIGWYYGNFPVNLTKFD